MSDADSELDLVDKARNGSTEAFCELVRIHQSAVRAYVAGLVRGRDVVEDMAQEVFLAAHRSLAAFRGDGRFRAWLLGIAHRQVAWHLREQTRRQGRTTAPAEDAFLRLQSEWLESGSTALLTHDRELQALEGCVSKLGHENLELLSAHYFKAETAASIARRLGRRENAVRMALLRIRQALKTCMEQALT